MWTQKGMGGSVAAIVAVSIALFSGCSPAKPVNMVPATGDNQNDNAPPKTNHKDDAVPATEARLVEVERAILAKQAELAKLQAEAESLIGLRKAGKGQNKQENRDPAVFFRDMPQEAYPKYGEQGGIERAACRKWLKDEFVPGQVVEWDVRVMSVTDSGEGPYEVVVRLEKDAIAYVGAPVFFFGGWPFGDPVLLGATKCQVVLKGYVGINPLDPESTGTPTVRFDNCSEQDVKRLRNLKGKNVVASGKVEKVELHDGPIWIIGKEDESDPEQLGQVALRIEVPDLTIDGFVPSASEK